MRRGALEVLNETGRAVEVPTTQHDLLSAASAGVIFYSRDPTAFISAVAAGGRIFRTDFRNFRTDAALSSESSAVLFYSTDSTGYTSDITATSMVVTK